MAEQIEVFEDATNVKMPKVDVIGLDKYDLSEIQRDFVVPEFQRRWDREHTNKIVKAIMTNHFYDNIITVYREGNKYWIIDGQHRINALKICYALYKLRYYSIILVIFPKEHANTVFRRNNLGKKLSVAEMLNSMKDVNAELFRRMRKYVDSYRNKDRIGIGDLFNAFVFLEGKHGYSGVTLLEEFLPKIDKEHIDAMERMMAILTQIEPEPNYNPIYRAPSFRAIYRLAFELHLDERKIGKMVGYIRRTQYLLDLTQNNKHAAVVSFYNKLLESKSSWF